MLFFILRNSIAIDSQQHVKSSQSSPHWNFSRQSKISVHPWEPDQSIRNGFHHSLLCKKLLSSRSTDSPFLRYFSEAVQRDNHNSLIYSNVFPYFYNSFIPVSTVQYITVISLAKILFFTSYIHMRYLFHMDLRVLLCQTSLISCIIPAFLYSS